jgi:hypothetical protein
MTPEQSKAKDAGAVLNWFFALLFKWVVLVALGYWIFHTEVKFERIVCLALLVITAKQKLPKL